MPTNPNIILAAGQGRPQSVDYNSARNVVMAGEALKSKQEQQDRQDAMQTQQAFQSALQQTQGDYDKAADLLDSQGHNTLGLRESLAKQRKATADAATAHLTQLEKTNELMSGYAANITDQQSLNRYGPLLHRSDPEMQIPMTYVGNEAYFQGLGALGKTGQDVLNRAKDSLKSYKDGDLPTGFAKAVWATTNDEDLQAAIQFAKTQQHVPDYVINSVVPQGTQWSPELTQRAQMLAMGPKEAYDAQQKADKPAPVGSDYHQYAERWAREHGTTFENLTTKQEQQARKEYGQADDRALKVSVGGGGAPSAGDLTPEGIDYAATIYRLTNKMPPLGMGKTPARGQIINKAAEQTRLLGQTPVAAIQRQAMFSADNKSLGKIQTMSDAASAYEQKALSQLDIVDNLSDKVSRSSIPLLNRALLAGKTEIQGDPNATLLLNAIQTATAEYSKIMAGGTGSAQASSDSAMREAQKLLRASFSAPTLRKATGLMRQEMGLTMQGYDAAIKHIQDRIGGQPQQQAAPAIGPNDVQAPNGKTYHFATKAQADAFKQKAGIQ